MTLTKMAYFSHFFLEIIIYAPLRSSRTNMSREQIIRKLHDEDALHDYPAQQTALRAESYFNYKDKMAANGINVFDPQIEHQFSSNKVKRERANLMVAYLEKYPQMLPDSLDLKKSKQASIITELLDV